MDEKIVVRGIEYKIINDKYADCDVCEMDIENCWSIICVNPSRIFKRITDE